jgi:hypothetical protein
MFINNENCKNGSEREEERYEKRGGKFRQEIILSRAPGLIVAVALKSFVRREMICSFAAVLFRGWPFDVRIEFVDPLSTSRYVGTLPSK